MKEILQTWETGSPPQPEELKQLAVEELADVQRANAFQITPETVTDVMAQRSQLFHPYYNSVGIYPIFPTV
jgi:hypothetical protein